MQANKKGKTTTILNTPKTKNKKKNEKEEERIKVESIYSVVIITNRGSPIEENDQRSDQGCFVGEHAQRIFTLNALFLVTRSDTWGCGYPVDFSRLGSEGHRIISSLPVQ